MAVALNGNLQDFGIAEVFQLIGQQRKTGFLELEHAGERLRIGFDRGVVVSGTPVGEVEFSALGEHLVRVGILRPEQFDRSLERSRVSACPLPDLWLEEGLVSRDLLREMSDLLVQESLFRLMGWPAGSFHFSSQAVPNEFRCENAVGVEQVLMDGLRMLDEWRTFAPETRSRETVFRAVEVPRDSESSVAGAEQGASADLLQWVDGQRCVGQIIDRSRLGTFQATRILDELQRARRIERVADTRSPARMRNQRDPWATAAAGLRVAAASLLPLFVLALVVTMGLAQRPLDWPLRGKPVVKRPLEEVRILFERRRSQQVQLAERYLLGDLSPGGWAPPADGFLVGGRLAPDSASAYHGSMRRHSFVPAPASR